MTAKTDAQNRLALRHLRARIAGHLLRSKAENQAGHLALGRFHKETADALCVSLVDALNNLETVAK